MNEKIMKIADEIKALPSGSEFTFEQFLEKYAIKENKQKVKITLEILKLVEEDVVLKDGGVQGFPFVFTYIKK